MADEKIIDGKAIAQEIKDAVRAEAVEFKAARGRAPKLVAVQVGECSASQVYTNAQAKNAGECELDYELRIIPADIDDARLLAELNSLNGDPAVDGIILQMPLPSHLDTYKAQAAISSRKDVEGVAYDTMGRIFFGRNLIAPCTPLAVMEIISRYCEPLAGKEVVLVGASEIVGKPLAMLMLQRHGKMPTLTICSSRTRDLAAHTRNADIVITAAGVSQIRWRNYKNGGCVAPAPDLKPIVSGDMLKEGAVVIDVATNRVPVGFDAAGQPLKKPDGKMDMHTVGDVDFNGAIVKASKITPVPGGVGPVTVAILLRNTLVCAKNNNA